MATVDFKLYFIGDRHQTNGRPLTDVIRAAAEAGVSAFQFREKDLSPRVQFDLATEIRTLTKEYKMKFLINDRVDLCLSIDADGVHLPASGLPVNVARTLLGDKKLIAVSCHSEKEVKNAEAMGANFAVLGPIYDTPSKRPYGLPLTLDTFRAIKRQTTLPLFAIGGINSSRVDNVFAAGADGIAIISNITRASNVKHHCQNLLKKIDSTASFR